jgi:hypothetical protein
VALALVAGTPADGGDPASVAPGARVPGAGGANWFTHSEAESDSLFVGSTA